jgi:cellulose synthase/poly-beta-1,6-N-acetylglucosamine synthase-like glycosyltransferase
MAAVGSERCPRASFVVPATDEADYLEVTLCSLRGLRTELSYEVIVVDGGSEDRTPEIAREHGARLLVRPRRGIGGARHAGAEHASGDWLAFVDATRSSAATTSRRCWRPSSSSAGPLSPRSAGFAAAGERG